MTNLNSIELTYTGNYSLARSISLAAKAAFVEGFTVVNIPGIYLSFALEGSWKPVCVKVVEESTKLILVILDNPESAGVNDITNQVKRILCLDIDGAGFSTIGQEDTIIAKLQIAGPGIRPVLYNTPYEAAARVIIRHQLPVKYAALLSA